MATAKIFISHSAKTPEAREYLRDLHAALGNAKGIEPLLDEAGLDGGDDWRERIYSWMDEAHGAVILLSKEALQSSFVPIELSILSFRNCREHHFPLIPVLIGDVTPDDTNHGVIGDLDLSKIQYIQGMSSPGAAQKVVALLERYLGTLPRLLTPRQILEREIADCLREAGLSETDLDETAATVAEWPAIACSSRRDGYFSFAQSFFGANIDFASACRIVRELARRRTRAADRLYDLLGVIAPLWIREQDAVPLAERALAKTHERLLALDVVDSWSARSFICRACMRPLDKGWRVCELEPPTTEDDAMLFQETKHQIYESLKPRRSRFRHIGDQLIKELLERYDAEGEPVFVLFPRGWPLDAEFFGKLRNEFRTLAVLVLAPTPVTGIVGEPFFGLPCPGRDREHEARMAYLQTESDLEKWGG